MRRRVLRKDQIVSLLTDFGSKDSYVGTMKGVILGICPSITLVDLSHEVEKHDVLQGAFLLSQASPYFPEGSIHLAVVDPGVGTARRRIIVQGSRCIYIGPDNGILSLAAKREGVIKIFEIDNEKFMFPHPSRTFEGRDIFAPAAAYLAKGIDVDEFGTEIHSLTSLSIAEPERRGGELHGEVIYIDGFGNMIMNIPEDILGEITYGTSVEVTIGRVSRIVPFCRTYSEALADSPLLTLGSSGLLEVAVNSGSAQSLFKARVGSRVAFKLIS